MKIVIAAWHLGNVNVGLGRYCRGLIDALGRVDAESRYDILFPTATHPFPSRPNMRYRAIRFPVFKRRFWEQTAPQLVGRYDVLHFPYDSCVAWKRGKFVVTVHDVKPLLFGELRPRLGLYGAAERWLVGDRWGKIDHVITDSACSRRDIIERLGVPPERVTVVYPGVDRSQFSPGPPEQEVAARGKSGREGGGSDGVGSTARPYVLCVAGPDPTKNVSALVEAFARLPKDLRDAHDLVLAGDFRRRPELREQVARLGLEDRTRFPGVVDEDRLVALYRRASLFVFPSRYEGFGLPVLEAMACGCPVIASSASSLPEVVGDAGLLVDPDDADGFADAMSRVLCQVEVRQALRERGLARAALFDWERTARETLAIYKHVAAGSSG